MPRQACGDRHPERPAELDRLDFFADRSTGSGRQFLKPFADRLIALPCPEETNRKLQVDDGLYCIILDTQAPAPEFPGWNASGVDLRGLDEAWPVDQFRIWLTRHYAKFAAMRHFAACSVSRGSSSRRLVTSGHAM